MTQRLTPADEAAIRLFYTDAEQAGYRTGTHMMSVLAELDAVRAERNEARNATEALRHTLNDANPRGKTILDFLNLWLDQERDTNAKLKARITRLQQVAGAARLYADEREPEVYSALAALQPGDLP